LSEELIEGVELPGPTGPEHRAAPRSFRIERADATTDYSRFAFSDPEEQLLLPSRVETVTVIRNSAMPRVRVTQTFTNYRRFLTTARVVP
jgi:hypothetical protein